VILMDAYSTGAYGSSLPAQLTTKEFFKIADEHLTTNGVLATTSSASSPALARGWSPPV